MSKRSTAALLALGLMACSNAAFTGSERRDADRWAFRGRALDRTLVAGTLVGATISGSLSWSRNQPSDTLLATVSDDVRNGDRSVVIPAGCLIGLSIALAQPSPNTISVDVPLSIAITSVTVGGRPYPVTAAIQLPFLAVPGTERDGEALVPGTPILFVLSEGLTVERRLDEENDASQCSSRSSYAEAPYHTLQ